MRIGIDLGGTKIEAIALDDDGREHGRTRIATPAHDYDATIAAIVGLVDRLDADRTGASVGVGIPGSMSPATGLVRNANSTWLNGRPFDRDLASALARPLRVANDANCFALSEAVDGAGAGQRVVFGVILGTGVGGGIVVDGSVWTGHNGVAGEWGHQRLPQIDADDLPLPRCWCGRDGCIETYLSGPALLADHRAHGGRAASTAAVVTDARRGDAAAVATLRRYRRRLVKGLAMVINVVDPDVIVLGGGLSNVDEFRAVAPSDLGAFVFSDVVTTPVVRNRHGDASGVRGAAWLWPARDDRRRSNE